jgi:ABC-type dipeptide/oligopeptide/nickel transport system permease component
MDFSFIYHLIPLNKKMNSMEQSSDLFELQIDQPSINYLSETARWSRFLAIIGFIGCGLMVIVGLFFGSEIARNMPGMGDSGMTAAVGVFFSFFVIFTSLIMFFPSLYLFNFSSKMRKALNNNDQPTLTDSLKNLKSFFKFWGILLIVYLSIYALAIIFAIIGAILGRH